MTTDAHPMTPDQRTHALRVWTRFIVEGLLLTAGFVWLGTIVRFPEWVAFAFVLSAAFPATLVGFSVVGLLRTITNRWEAGL